MQCCDLFSTPIRLSVVNLQTFVVGIHHLAHDIYSMLEMVNKQRVRLSKASVESEYKARKDLNQAVHDLGDKIAQLEKSYSDPYMEKTRVHYPEVHKVLQQLLLRVQNDRRLKDLAPKEP